MNNKIATITAGHSNTDSGSVRFSKWVIKKIGFDVKK